ncbi:enoyl-CoA hydratase [Oceanococcus atlanticus]|uniref:Enoyl-CoA hydratase n=2 Tax=Oceanococcus atlanticus TaxID=1317117 RepID=A0A1Y1SB18_9GAMM|nr:enoyl-CoA hydratase [Oceanococcus atlanticus]
MAYPMTTARQDSVLFQTHGAVCVVTINRPSVRNCVDGETTRLLHEAFVRFEQDEQLRVAVLTGAGEHFCAGADLKAVSAGDEEKMRRIREDQDGPMGPTRMSLSKPVIAAVSGYCVAGGLELAAWCDLRVADESAVFGVFCRRFGVPLIDGGTVRLPRLIGMSHALDLILTGRPVQAEEAAHMGLANRVVPTGQALDVACQLAEQLAAFPQQCMRGDRQSAYEQWGLNEHDALSNEARHGRATLASGETGAGAGRFTAGLGRHGDFGA